MWNILVKRVSHNQTILSLGTTLGCIVGLPFVVFMHSDISFYTMAFWAFISGTVHLVYYFALTTAYFKYPISSIYPISRGLGILGGSLFGIVYLKNPFTLGMALSAGLIIAGIVLFHWKNNSVDSYKMKGSLFWALFVGVSIAVYVITDIIAVQYIPGLPHTIYLFLVMNIYLMVFFSVKHPIQLKTALTQYKTIAILIGTGALMSYSLILFVIKSNPISNVLSLRETSIITAAIISRFYLKEHLKAKQWIAIGLICCGAIGIKWLG